MAISKIENAKLLGRAIIGNAFEKIQTNYGQYIQEMAREKPTRYNPALQEIIVSLEEQVQERFRGKSFNRKNTVTLPWVTGTRRHAAPSRLAASIIAFSDAQGKKIIPEFFPVDAMKTFLSHVEDTSTQAQQPLTIPEQFHIALDVTGGNPLAAAVLAHSSYRAIARGKDTRISSELAFTHEERMRVARATADFHTVNSPSRDPLGDTYHWWASFAAGLDFTLEKWRYPVQTRIYRTAFYHEALLTTAVRKVLLRRTSITNHHKDVDRQGLLAGKTLGNFLRRL